MKKICFYTLFMLCCFVSWAQLPIQYDNHSYDPNVFTARLSEGDIDNAYPIHELSQPIPLRLQFDYTLQPEAQEPALFADFILCDADWNPSNLIPLEFYDGQNNVRLNSGTRSQFTKVPYVHYEFSFPQEGEAFKMSGNYLLYVYHNGDRNDPVLTKRFVVTESKMGIQIQNLFTGTPRSRFRQFDVVAMNTGKLQVFNPAMDLKVQVLQNNRWDNAATLSPRFYSNEKYEYRLNAPTDFNTGNEFRRLDIRSINLYGIGMKEVIQGEWVNEVNVIKDKPRPGSMFQNWLDFNGGFLVSVNEWADAASQADYLSCNFSLKPQDGKYEGEVYVMGSFCDWQYVEANRMTYDEALREYKAAILLKQGVYDYCYAVKKEGEKANEALIEGPANQDLENFYTVLIYFKAPTDRTHRVVGYARVNY